MIVFPNCKINLGLQVLQKRSDGFHDIETIFYPVPLKDALEIVPQNTGKQPAFINYGLPVQGEATDNICIKAWNVLKADFPDLPPVQIHLLKNIPMGAGLGGGSADGAFMLQLLNNKFQLQLSLQQLVRYALQLGSDCPFFIINKPSYATGRGEQTEPVDIDLSAWQLVLTNPGIHIHTGWAFGQLEANRKQTKTNTLKQSILQPVTAWKEQLLNDFEKPVFEKYPEIKSLTENLYRAGAVYASMSGSGSTVFGLFEASIHLSSGLPAHYRVIRL
ncbi:MAG: 4-(cytidine 5'-diphospho)-2-C-methyl-D-erythritol kinase [Chitinophagaceae bacterium]